MRSRGARKGAPIGVLIGVACAQAAGYPPVLVGGVAILGIGMLIGAVQHTWAVVLNVDLDQAPDGVIGPVVPPPSAPVAKRGATELPQSRSQP